jgi:hypothetical protein
MTSCRVIVFRASARASSSASRVRASACRTHCLSSPNERFPGDPHPRSTTASSNISVSASSRHPLHSPGRVRRRAGPTARRLGRVLPGGTDVVMRDLRGPWRRDVSGTPPRGTTRARARPYGPSSLIRSSVARTRAFRLAPSGAYPSSRAIWSASCDWVAQIQKSFSIASVLSS